MDRIAKDLKHIFLKANSKLLNEDLELFLCHVSERTLCGALKQHLDYYIAKTRFCGYHTDVEYNRNINGRIKTCCIEDEKDGLQTITINCDLIVHSRGHIIEQDNLIAIEMKKSNRSKKEKDADKKRLKALTKNSFDDIWSFDGTSLPEHVCRYKLGVYYEINYRKHTILLEYYYHGNKQYADTIAL